MNVNDYEILISCGFKWQSLGVLHKDFFEKVELIPIDWAHLTLGPNLFLYKYKSGHHAIIRKKCPDKSMY